MHRDKLFVCLHTSVLILKSTPESREQWETTHGPMWTWKCSVSTHRFTEWSRSCLRESCATKSHKDNQTVWQQKVVTWKTKTHQFEGLIGTFYALIIPRYDRHLIPEPSFYNTLCECVFVCDAATQPFILEDLAGNTPVSLMVLFVSQTPGRCTL